MKASMLEPSDDDIFSSSTTRSYNSFNKTRPTMISAKYRLKEERRKVLKISISKLKKIEDPESSLRRSVLINNTMKRLQKEARDERREKQQIHSFPRYSPSYKSFVLREEPPKPVADDPMKTPDLPSSRLKPDSDKENASPFPSERKHPPKSSLEACFCDETMEELVDVTSLDDELSRPLEELANPVNLLETTSMDEASGRCASRKRSFDEDTVRPLETFTSLMDTADERTTVDAEESSSKRRCEAELMDTDVTSRKRSYEDVEDAEIHDVLSQFYMPPTPRMLTSIDDDEDEEVNVVDIEIEMPLSPTAIVPKVIGFDELVREELKDEPITLVDNRSDFDLLDEEDVVASPCKRPRFDSGSLIHDVPVFDNLPHPNNTVKSYPLPFEPRSGEKTSYCYSGTAVTTTTTATGESKSSAARFVNEFVSRTCAATPSGGAVAASTASDVGSVNCGTVSTSVASSESDDCAAASLLACSRGVVEVVEIRDMKNIDFTAKESHLVDRRSHITRISDVMSWTALMNDSRIDSQDYKYNNNNNNIGLSKTLTDCCYTQETNNNLSETNKYSCAHAAITELQSQVYHSYVTSLES